MGLLPDPLPLCAALLTAGVLGLLLWPEPEPAPLRAAPALAVPALSAPAPPVDQPALPPPAFMLAGILPDTGRGAAAVITTSAGKQRLVTTGAAVAGGWRVQRIHSDRIILARGAAQLDLALPQPDGGSVTAPAGPDSLSATAYRLALAPVERNGRPIGYQLKPGPLPPIFADAGLQAGDVILLVNGQQFDSEEKLLELPQEIAGAYAMRFTIERGGQQLELPAGET